MGSGSILMRSDWEEFILSLYFGQPDDPLMGCVRRAYLDLSRTLHGMAALPQRDTLVGRANAEVRQWLSDLQHDQVQLSSQRAFDNWHRDKCTRLIAIFKAYPKPILHYGQAQKWLNMAFKYVFAFGEQRLPGFAPLYPYCHVPLDSVLLERLAPLGAPVPDGPWSRWADYDEYLGLQIWVRNRFWAAPLDVEFHLWLGRPVPE